MYAATDALFYVGIICMTVVCEMVFIDSLFAMMPTWHDTFFSNSITIAMQDV